jgi:hypothetical protein
VVGKNFDREEPLDSAKERIENIHFNMWSYIN